ncbi:MAG: FAD:protein FMN transferase [Planctomycetota bacterium]|nr:FAD:protein FMN transferase [Planctomycetota bacterium]
MSRLILMAVVVANFPIATHSRAETKNGRALEKFEFTEPHMGVPFKLVFYASDTRSANLAAAAAFARIKQLNAILSDYLPESELSRLSKASPTPQPVRISDELWTVLRRSQYLAQKTGGAFDVTVGPFTSLWRRSRRRKELPPADRLEAARRAVGFHLMQLDDAGQTAQLRRAGMRLDLGGIAKGYAADEGLRVLKDQRITRAIVDGSGDIAIGEPPPGKDGWRIGLAPLRPGEEPSRFLSLARQAVATSGDAWQFVVVDGIRYSHIIDPATGLGLTTPSSVTVVARDCMTADSLASAVSVLGPSRGIQLVDSTCGAAAIIVRGPQPAGTEPVFVSARFSALARTKSGREDD